MNHKIRFFLLGVFIFLAYSPALFAGKTPADLFLTANVRDNIFFVKAFEHKENKAYLEKIEVRYLIESIRISPLTFIRNNNIHSGPEAAAHFSRKYAVAGNRVKNPRDFIEGIAAKSMLSGKPYLVKTSAGQTYSLRDVLYQELKRLEQSLK
ncbi:MAG: DUF5329 family protein [Candidatus Omnitrophica bacterium]|nr:DUF5329 family protein [Candidatus Omnitrophota bacterium]